MSKKTQAIKDNKNNKAKKIALTLVLLVIIGILAYIIIVKPNSDRPDPTTKTFTQVKEDSGDIIEDEYIESGEAIEMQSNDNAITENKSNEGKEVQITKLKDGTLYTISGEKKKADLVIGNNYYDTQLSDVNLNFSKYEGKTVEIEGFYMEDTPYTFVGRYSESNLCAYCPQGYSYFEYEWHGNNKFNFTNENEWLKIVGTFRKGHDELGDYYYIDASSIQVMKERGQDTVKN